MGGGAESSGWLQNAFYFIFFFFLLFVTTEMYFSKIKKNKKNKNMTNTSLENILRVSAQHIFETFTTL